MMITQVSSRLRRQASGHTCEGLSRLKTALIMLASGIVGGIVLISWAGSRDGRQCKRHGKLSIIIHAFSHCSLFSECMACDQFSEISVTVTSQPWRTVTWNWSLINSSALSGFFSEYIIKATGKETLPSRNSSITDDTMCLRGS